MLPADPPLQPGMYIRLSVSDNGHGISPEHMPRIFEPYFTTKAKGKGHGFRSGHRTRNIITSHGGAILVESEINKGTTFHGFTCPSPRGTNFRKPYKTFCLCPRARNASCFWTMKKACWKSVKDILTRLGYEGCALFRIRWKVWPDSNRIPTQFDLIVTDMTMPGMTGDKVCEEITKVRADIPIVVCSGFSEQVSPFNTKRAGATAFLMKPYVMSEFSNVIRSTLDKRP